DLYFQPAWNKTMRSIFPNSQLVQNKPAARERRQRHLAMLFDWLKTTETLSKKKDSSLLCATCGRVAHVKLNRSLLPLTDAKNQSFHSFNEEGVPLCGACALAVQFMPLGLAKVGGKLALPQFSDADAQYTWSEWCWRRTLVSETTDATGPVDAGTARAANAFFALIERLLRESAGCEIPDSSITLYLFTNYNQGPDVELHYLPTEVFRFIKQAMAPSLQRAWRQVVRRGYVRKSREIDPKTLDEGEQLKKRTNHVYEHLLHDRSISSYFIDHRQRRPVSDWRLFKAYLKEVHGMNEQRLESLRDLGNRISEIIRNKRKRLLALERANRKGEFVEQLYRLSKDAAAAGQDRPLITFDELVQDVFPHDPEKYESWREVKYLLLFRVYEMLYDELRADTEWTTSDESEEVTEEVTR
ncbi:MAG TPA: type I-B CRISPR-associated protein Cas8b1/Cst1, partial [Candidatus Acetothermia bacterium]|nr:type I-B CRISPR-associated protein Cas8b1/Cst1 [Candidatus Acetothermia bacterium]